MDSHAFLQNLAVVLCVAAVATIVFQRLQNDAALAVASSYDPVGRRMPSPD